MLREGLDIVTTAIKWYFSGGYTWLLFLIAVILLWFARKKEESVFFLVKYSAIYTIVCMNPVSAIVLSKLGMDGVYWRALWFIPIGVVIVSAAVVYIAKLKKTMLVMAGTLAACIVIMVAGALIYRRDNFDMAHNPYKIPDKIIELGDVIEDGRHVVGPYDVMVWLRTYTADVTLPYGRQDIFFEGTEYQMLLYNATQSETWVLTEVMPWANSFGCNCVVVEKTRPIYGELEWYDYYLAAETDEYYIYYK